MEFSSSSKQLALGFVDGSVGLVALLSFKGGQTRWDVVGQQTAHPAPAALVGLTFGEAPSGVTKLFSLGTNMKDSNDHETGAAIDITMKGGHNDSDSITDSDSGSDHRHNHDADNDNLVH